MIDDSLLSVGGRGERKRERKKRKKRENERDGGSVNVMGRRNSESQFQVDK